MQNYRELLTAQAYESTIPFLQAAGLDLPDGISYGLGCYEDDQLVGTGFLAGSVVCGICVSPSQQGGGLASSLLSRLIVHGVESGIRHFMIFTKPAEAAKFEEFGFVSVAGTTEAALLEWGQPDCASWLAGAKDQLGALLANTPVSTASHPTDCLAAIVMNANPFTLGHQHLVRQALAVCPRVAVFVVEEDSSIFPFAVRLQLVQQGIADLAGAVALPAGPYMVSRGSFPAYFTGKSAHSRVHAALDSTIFASRIAKKLGVTTRIIGTEPYCEVTSSYNATLKAILPRYGVECLEIHRKESAGEAISASRVRSLLHTPLGSETLKTLETLVPPSTLKFLQSAEAAPIREKLRNHHGRH